MLLSCLERAERSPSPPWDRHRDQPAGFRRRPADGDGVQAAASDDAADGGQSPAAELKVD